MHVLGAVANGCLRLDGKEQRRGKARDFDEALVVLRVDEVPQASKKHKRRCVEHGKQEYHYRGGEVDEEVVEVLDVCQPRLEPTDVLKEPCLPVLCDEAATAVLAHGHAHRAHEGAAQALVEVVAARAADGGRMDVARLWAQGFARIKAAGAGRELAHEAQV